VRICAGQSPVDVPIAMPGWPRIAWRYGCPKSNQIGCVLGRPHVPAYGAGVAERPAADAGEAARSRTRTGRSFFTDDPSSRIAEASEEGFVLYRRFEHSGVRHPEGV